MGGSESGRMGGYGGPVDARLSQFEEVLMAGVEFTKHTRKGLVVILFVCNTKTGEMMWGDPSATTPSRRANLFKVAVVPGRQTKRFQEMYDDVPEDCCFSLVGVKKTLDLSCQNALERDDCIDGFLALQERRKIARGNTTKGKKAAAKLIRLQTEQMTPDAAAIHLQQNEEFDGPISNIGAPFNPAQEHQGEWGMMEQLEGTPQSRGAGHIHLQGGPQQMPPVRASAPPVPYQQGGDPYMNEPMYDNPPIMEQGYDMGMGGGNYDMGGGGYQVPLNLEARPGGQGPSKPQFGQQMLRHTPKSPRKQQRNVPKRAGTFGPGPLTAQFGGKKSPGHHRIPSRGPQGGGGHHGGGHHGRTSSPPRSGHRSPQHHRSPSGRRVQQARGKRSPRKAGPNTWSGGRARDDSFIANQPNFPNSRRPQDDLDMIPPKPVFANPDIPTIANGLVERFHSLHPGEDEDDEWAQCEPSSDEDVVVPPPPKKPVPGQKNNAFSRPMTKPLGQLNKTDVGKTWMMKKPSLPKPSLPKPSLPKPSLPKPKPSPAAASPVKPAPVKPQASSPSQPPTSAKNSPALAATIPPPPPPMPEDGAVQVPRVTTAPQTKSPVPKQKTLPGRVPKDSGHRVSSPGAKVAPKKPGAKIQRPKTPPRPNAGGNWSPFGPRN